MAILSYLVVCISSRNFLTLTPVSVMDSFTPDFGCTHFCKQGCQAIFKNRMAVLILARWRLISGHMNLKCSKRFLDLDERVEKPTCIFLFFCSNFCALKFFDVLIYDYFQSKDLFEMGIPEVPFKTIIASFFTIEIPFKAIKTSFLNH